MKAPLYRALILTAAAMTAGCTSLDSTKLVSYGHNLFVRMHNLHNDDAGDAPVASKETASPHRSEAAPLPRNASSQVVRPFAAHKPPIGEANAGRIPQDVDRHDAAIAQGRIGERASGFMSASPAILISPDTPLAELGAAADAWDLYKVFEFQRVIAYALAYAGTSQTSKYEAVTVYTLAAASAYLTGDGDKALTLLRQAVRASRDARPDAKYFPSLFCAMYEKTLLDEGQESTTAGGAP